MQRQLRRARAVLLACLALGACVPPREVPKEPEAAQPLPKVLQPPPPTKPREPQPEPPPIVLHARDAKVHGKTARYEKSNRRDNIGFWTNAQDYVTWDFELKVPGTYMVQVTTACPANTAGSTYAVAVGDEQVTAIVKSTGNWGNFVTEPIGVLDLTEPGRKTLSVKPVVKRGGAVMNLQAVILRYGRWTPGLAAWWRFDEGSGTIAEDSVGGAKDTVQFARWGHGVWRRGLRLNGCTSGVVRPAAAVPSLKKGLSIEAWVRLDTPPSGWCPLVNQHAYPLGFFFGFDGAGDLILHVGAGGKWLTCTSSVRPPLRRWTHVAATFDPRHGLAVYVDGRQTGRLAARGELTPATDTDLVIGKHNQHPWALHGVVDEVRLYKRALTAGDVRDRYAKDQAEMELPPQIAIEAVRADRLAARVYERVTLELDLQATFDSPFDADDIRVDAVVAAPSRRVWRAPGFWCQPFARSLEGDKEKLEPAGQPRWQVRLSFDEPGTHHLRVVAEDRTGHARSEPLQILVTEADVSGMIRRHAAGSRYLATDRGETFFPIGANVCWGGGRATFSYDEWLPRYAAAGCNAFRVWLSPHWTTFGMNTAASGFDAIDLANAWRLDHVLEAAERLGLRVMLCIDSFNILRSKERSPGVMEDTPYVRSQGGPVVRPLDYFTDPLSLKAYRNRLRYLVARYGYSPGVLAWELWNEVDIIDEYHSETVVAWHAEMADYLRRLDPWQHLITTSCANPKGDPELDNVPGLDLIQIHRYGGDDLVKALGDDVAGRQGTKQRPFFHGELGISGDGKQTAETDPRGIHIHNALYASVGQGSAGAPMTWWWDLYVHPKNLYPVFGAFARWIEGFDFVAQKARPAQAKLVGETQTIERGVLQLAKGSWDPAPVNKPLTVRVDRNGLMTCAVAPSELLHGLGFHKPKHNPVTFELDVPEPTTFAVEVAKYSGFGNGHLEIHVDGKRVLEQDFPVPPGNQKDTLTEGAGLYTVPVPEGRHAVKVVNTGQDWIALASYRIPWLKVRKTALDPLRVYGVAGETGALLWVQNRQHTWANATKQGYAPTAVSGAGLKLTGLRPGRWAVEHWDTHKGEVTRREEAVAGSDGAVTVRLPEILWDAALRLRRYEPDG